MTEAVEQEEPRMFCFCSHDELRHPHGPCLILSCGCGWWRPDTRGQQGGAST